MLGRASGRGRGERKGERREGTGLVEERGNLLHEAEGVDAPVSMSLLSILWVMLLSN